MLYLERTDRVVSIKPEAKEGCQSLLHQRLNEFLNITNYLMVDSKYTEIKLKVIKALGIVEDYYKLGISSGSKLPIYYYQKSINRYLGVIRLLDEILYGEKSINQDLTVFLQRLFYEKEGISFLYGIDGIPIEKELERLTTLIDKATDKQFLDSIRTGYPDFTLFWEQILPLISLDKVAGEWSLPEFDKLSLGLTQPNITLAENNSRILALAEKAPRFMI